MYWRLNNRKVWEGWGRIFSLKQVLNELALPNQILIYKIKSVKPCWNWVFTSNSKWLFLIYKLFALQIARSSSLFRRSKGSLTSVPPRWCTRLYVTQACKVLTCPPTLSSWQTSVAVTGAPIIGLSLNNFTLNIS